MAPNQNLRRQVPRRLFLLRLNGRGDVVFSRTRCFSSPPQITKICFIEGLWRVPSEFHKP